MTADRKHYRGPMALVAVIVVLFAATGVAQTGPPIPGVTGVVVPEGGGDGATSAVAAAAVKVAEGTRHLLRAVGIGKDDPAKRVDSLDALAVGATVVLSYDADAAAPEEPNDGRAPRTTEGRIIELDRRNGVILVRLADRTTERLRLAGSKGTDLASGSPTKDADADRTISVSFVDVNGNKIVILFQRAW